MKKLFLISFICLVSTVISFAQLKVSTTGNVGIGTTSTPNFRLDLANGTFGFGNSNVRTETRNNAGLYGTGVQSGFYETYTPTNYPTGATSYWHLIDCRHSNTGNNYALQIAGSFYDQDLYYRKTNNSASTTWKKILTADNGGVTISSGSVNYVSKMTSSSNISNSQIFDNGTNVGINTTSLNAKLHVIQDQSGNTGFLVNKTAGSDNSYNIISQVQNNLVRSIVTNNSGTDRLCVWGDGQVNIGGVYRDNTYKLTVYGPSYVNGYGYFNGIVYGTRFSETSDAIFKQNITSIETPLEKIIQINGKKYEYNTTAFPNMNFPSGYTYGVLAQEVQVIIPELVTTDSVNHYFVNYNGFIPIIIEAIKAQQLKIEEQEEKLNIQSEKINALATEVANCCNIKPTEKMLNQTQGSNNTNNNSTTAILYQNMPNPFKIKTTIQYYLPNESNVASMLIFDMQGKLIKTYNINTTGDGNIEINAGELQPGMYMYSLIANGKEVDTKKMILTD